MFNKNIEVTILTRTENKDNFKVMRLCETFQEPGTMAVECSRNSEDIKIKFETRKSNVKKLKEYLNVLNFVGIKAEMEIK